MDKTRNSCPKIQGPNLLKTEASGSIKPCEDSSRTTGEPSVPALGEHPLCPKAQGSLLTISRGPPVESLRSRRVGEALASLTFVIRAEVFRHELYPVLSTQVMSTS